MSIRVRPLTTAIGAEITGLDLREPLSDALLGAVREALVRHLVIFVRDQDISVEEGVL